MQTSTRSVAGARRSDALVAGAFLVLSLIQVLWLQPVNALWAPDLGWYGALFAVVSTAPLAWRRVRPATAAIVGGSMWWIPTDAFLFLGYVCVVLLFFAVGRWSRSLARGVATCVGGLLSGTCGFLLIEHENRGFLHLLLDVEIRDWVAELRVPGSDVLLAMLGFWLLVAGSYGAGRFLAVQQRVAAARIAAEREVARRDAVADERARIVRELHDVVGHEVTLMSIQSEAAAQALEHAPERAAGPVAAVRETAHRAGRELRAILDLLGNDELPVTPDGRGLAELVERASRLGIAASLHVTGEPWTDAPRHWLAVNRIVQESLTNAGKHAPGQEVEVQVTWSDEVVLVHVVNPAAPTDSLGSGHGLPGMAERARLLGGSLEAGHRDGSFKVSARLPAPEGRLS